MAESALAVNVPEAEPYVSAIRDRFDPSAKVGAPAHITVLYPFVAPDCITSDVLSLIEAAISHSPAFKFHLTKLGRFSDTLYLVPEPVEPFIALMDSIVHSFPNFLPYGGQHASIVPHLTIARGSEADLASVETRLSETVPMPRGIFASCEEVVLIENSSGRWQRMRAFSLRAPVQLAG